MSNLEDVLDDAYREWRGAPDDADLPDLQADAVRAWLAEVAQRDEVRDEVSKAMEFVYWGTDFEAASWMRSQTDDATTAALAALVAAVTEVGK